MSGEPKYNLSRVNRFFTVVKNRLGTSNTEEIQRASDSLLNSISDHIEAGEQIAFLRRNKDGTQGLTTLDIEIDDED
ncbi:MAG TPA: hypothetical protein VIN60_03875 [Anaerolineales bacterium]